MVDLVYEDRAFYPFTGNDEKGRVSPQARRLEDEKALHGHARMQAVGHGAAD